MAALQGPIIRPVGELAHHSAPIVSLGSAYQSRRGAWADDLGCELVSADESGRLAVWEARSPGTHRWAGGLGQGVRRLARTGGPGPGAGCETPGTHRWAGAWGRA